MSPEQVAEVCRALGEPNRLRLLALLASQGTLCGCELEAVTGLAQYTISRGLGVLHRVGLVERERRGARREYRLATELEPGLAALLAAALAMIADDPQCRADLAAVGPALVQLNASPVSRA